MPDGNSGTAGHTKDWWSKRICENGKYFCKRDRNKAGTVGIYTCKGRQTVRVADTDCCAPEEVISDVVFGEIELALNRFVLTNLEAQKRERDGIKTREDLPVLECLNIYFIMRQKFHDDVLAKLDERINEAVKDHGLRSDEARALAMQYPRAEDAKRQEVNTLQKIIESVQRCWEKPPLCSQMDEEGQEHYVTMMRGAGYGDNSIRTWLVRIFSAMRYAKRKKRVRSVPDFVGGLWEQQEKKEVIIYELKELAALFDAAYRRRTHWKYMNLSLKAARPMTVIEATWPQINLTTARWDLNPPGKRITKKRRPTIPICPSLLAELSGWKHDHIRIVSNDKGKSAKSHKLFERIQQNAGITRGSAMSMRKTVRTWLVLHGVPETIADWIMGHADEGSDTGRLFYKAQLPQFMRAAAVAIELLYEALRKLCKVAVFAVPRVSASFQAAMDVARANYAANLIEETPPDETLELQPEPMTRTEAEMDADEAELRALMSRVGAAEVTLKMPAVLWDALVRSRCVTEMVLSA